MKKVYTPPTLVSAKIELGAFGDYGNPKPDRKDSWLDLVSRA